MSQRRMRRVDTASRSEVLEGSSSESAFTREPRGNKTSYREPEASYFDGAEARTIRFQCQYNPPGLSPLYIH